MFSKKRRVGQISVEYAMIIGLISFALAIAVSVAFFYSNSARAQIRMNQVDKIGNKIIENADSVYYLGYPSKVTIDLTMPEGVLNINLENSSIPNYIEFEYKGQGSSTYAIYYTNAKIWETNQPLNDVRFKSPGIKHLKVIANESGFVQFETTY